VHATRRSAHRRRRDSLHNLLIVHFRLNRVFVALDRDGTLIEYVPYLVDPEGIRVNTRAALAVRKLNELSIPVVVITNQPVIARGLASRETVDEIHVQISAELAKFDAFIHGYFVCPHSADGVCDCRKPKPGLVVQAGTSLGIAPSTCVIIGDSWRDIQLARALGVPGLHVQTGPERTHDGGEKSFPDVRSAVDYLIETIV